MPILGALGALRDWRIPRESWRKADIPGVILARTYNEQKIVRLFGLLFCQMCWLQDLDGIHSAVQKAKCRHDHIQLIQNFRTRRERVR